MLVKQAGKQVDFSKMDKAQEHNGDGYGVSWYEDKQVKTYRTFNYSAFKGVVSALKQYTLVAHLRYTTKGATDFSNIHPFEVPSGVMFHNGTIRSFGNAIKSDTRDFSEMISECDYKYIEDVTPLITPYINDSINRLVFFENNGQVTIMNEKLGVSEDGIWYSNDYHKKPKGWSRTGYKSTSAVVVKKKQTKLITPKIREHKVFVYGTLKKGYNNHKNYLEDAILLGKAKTKDKWTMIGKDMAFPYVIERHDKLGNNVVGEVYLVSDSELRFLDRLEGVPHHYIKQNITVKYSDDGSTDEVSIYTKTHFHDGYQHKTPIIAEWSK